MPSRHNKARTAGKPAHLDQRILRRTEFPTSLGNGKVPDMAREKHFRSLDPVQRVSIGSSFNVIGLQDDCWQQPLLYLGVIS